MQSNCQQLAGDTPPTYTFKQQLVNAQTPCPSDFEQERAIVLRQFFRSLKEFRINSWAARGFDSLFIIERFGLVYGFQAKDVEALLTVFGNMLFTEEVQSVESRAFVLKTLNSLLNLKVVIKGWSVDNIQLLNEYKRLTKDNLMVPAKHLESYMEELNTFTRLACRFGQDITTEVLELTIKDKQLKFLALFILSVKDESNAKTILQEIMCESGSWDRDCHWFFILSRLIENFPGLGYEKYFHTIFQTLIKDFCAISEPVNDTDLTRLLLPDDSTGIKPVMRSYAEILVNLLVPRSNPMCQTVWRYVERLLVLIIRPVDLKNQPNYLSFYMKFVRQFIKCFLKRVRKERRKDKGIVENEDYILNHEDMKLWFSDIRPDESISTEDNSISSNSNSASHLLDEYCISEFTRLMKSLFPTVVMTEDSSNCEVARICLELSTFDSSFLELSLQSITQILFSEEEMTLGTAKMVLLFLYEHIVLYVPEQLEILVKCCSRMIELVEKLGLIDHLDMVELVIRMFMYLPQDIPSTIELKHDVMDLIYDNLDSLATVLQLTDNSQAQLYIDLKNIFFPLLLKLTPEEIARYADRLAYKTTTAIPQHTEAYEMLMVAFSYVEPNLPSLVLPGVIRQLLKPGHSESYHDVLPTVDQVLTTENEENIRWYSMLIECTYQYQPANIVRDFTQLEKIFVLMMKEENAVLVECGWDILHNIVITLASRHLPTSNFSNPTNNRYQTLHIEWREPTAEEHELLMYITKRYVYDLIDCVKRRYAHVQCQLSEDDIIDAILVPKAIGTSALEEKKFLTKVLSIQQAVVSALLPVTPNCPETGGDIILEMLKPHMLSDLKTLRKDVIVYLKRVMEIINSLHLISEPALAKIFSFLYNELHGDCYISESLQSTQEKITGMIATSVVHPNKIMNCPFLIINDVVLAYHCKLELLNGLIPVAETVNPDHLKDLVVMSHHPDFTVSGKSLFKCPEQDLHEYHLKVLEVWWRKLDITNPNSYFKRLSAAAQSENSKERYANAISGIVQSLKKIGTYLAMECCVQDSHIRMLLFKFAGIYDLLKKKKDRSFLVDTLFALFSFQFDNTLITAGRTMSLNERQVADGRLCKVINNKLYDSMVTNDHIIEAEIPAKDYKASNETTRQCITQIVENCVNFLNTKKHTKELTLYALYALIYFPFVETNRALCSALFECFERLCRCEHHQLSQMGRVGVFHFINRFYKRQTVTTEIPNQPVKMPFEEFAQWRTFGCPQDRLTEAKMSKNENVFHTIPKIELFQDKPMDQASTDCYDRTIIDFLTSSDRILAFFNGCHNDKELIEDTPEDNDPIKTQGKAILGECLKLINYLLDRDPSKTNIFMGLVENFSMYECSFYLRLIKRMIRLGGDKTIQELEKVAKKLESREQIYAMKIYAYLSLSLLRYPVSEEFQESYLQQLSNCPNDVFTSHLASMSYVFRENPFSIKNTYWRIIEKLKKSRGSARLRYIEVWKIFILSQGRWARHEALEGIEWILAGVNEASEELADGLVAVIVETFILPLNLRSFKDWVQQPIYQLIKDKRVFRLNDRVGFEIHPRINEIFQLVAAKIQDEKDLQSTNLKMYTKLALRILESLTVYQFNDYFFQLLRGLIKYLVEKQQTTEEFNQNEILRRLGESQYPESVYLSVRQCLREVQSTAPVVSRKKLKLLEMLMFCHGYCSDRVEILDEVLQVESAITLNHIITLGNICRIMTKKELEEIVEATLAREDWKRYPLLMSFLIASGNANYEWREPALKAVVQWRLKKLMKEFIAYWWKGKGQGLKGEEALFTIVKNIQNHYTYFA